MATERRIIMIGKTGNGKSSTGNTLLGRRAFETGNCLNAVTEICYVRCAYVANNLRYTIVDTPGLMDTTNEPLGPRLLEIQRSLEICPEPHVFLLIFSSVIRMTKDEEYTVDFLRIVFGEKVLNHCIVVFTHGNKFESDPEFEEFWKNSDMMVKLVEKCGGRISRIENTGNVHHDQAIFDLIETISERGTLKYHYPWIQQHKLVLQEHIQKYERTGDLQNELSVLMYALGKVLPTNKWTVILAGGTILSLGALSATYIADLASKATTASSRATIKNSVTAFAAAAWSFGSRIFGRYTDITDNK